MKTKNLNMRSSRMRELVQETYGMNSTNIESIGVIFCDPKVRRNPMPTIPWSNVTYTRSSKNQFVLSYTNNNSNYRYRNVTPINVAADFRSDFSVKLIEKSSQGELYYECEYYIKNQRVDLGGGFIDSGSGLYSSILDASYIRIIILVTLEILLVDQEYLYSPVGFFYVDVDSIGNVSLKT